MKKIIFQLFLTCLTYVAGNGQSAIEANDEVKREFDIFLYMLEGYAQCTSRDEAFAKRHELMKKFAGDDKKHCNDLDVYTREEYNDYKVADYIASIMDDYDNKLLMEFEDISVDECFTEKNGKKYLVATALKTTTFADKQKKNYDCCFIYDVTKPPYRIDLVVEIERAPTSETCNATRFTSKQKDGFFKEYRNRGNAAFEKKDYAAAQKCYDIALEFKTDNGISERLAECKKYLNYEYYFALAEQQFNDKAYDKALENYYQAQKLNPTDATVTTRLKACEQKVKEISDNNKYNYNRQQGDSNLGRKIYQNALNFYRDAIIYKPGDTYCLTKIRECEEGLRLADPRYLKQRLEQARGLVALGNNKRYGEAIDIYTELLPSDILTADDYFKMGQIMNGQVQSVKDTMNYTNRYCTILAAEYIYKAAFEMNHQGAKKYWSHYLSRK